MTPKMTGSSVVRPPIISPLVPWFTLGCSPTVQLSLCGFRWRRTIRSSSPARTDDNFPPPRTQRISNLDEKPPHHKTKQRHTVMMWTFSLVTLLSVLQLSSSWVPMPPAERRATSLHLSVSLVEFSKYEGLGNDFILIDDRDKDTPSLTPEQSEKLCNRNFGVGGDGVIFALKPPSDQYDFAMRIYNSDGSEPEMCGNGIRCFAQFLKDLGAEGRSFVLRGYPCTLEMHFFLTWFFSRVLSSQHACGDNHTGDEQGWDYHRRYGRTYSGRIKSSHHAKAEFRR